MGWRKSTESETDGTRFSVGQRVSGNFAGEGLWYLGKVSKVHGDGSYAVLYDDGDVEDPVPADRVAAVDLHKIEVAVGAGLLDDFDQRAVAHDELWGEVERKGVDVAATAAGPGDLADGGGAALEPLEEVLEVQRRRGAAVEGVAVQHEHAQGRALSGGVAVTGTRGEEPRENALGEPRPADDDVVRGEPQCGETPAQDNDFPERSGKVVDPKTYRKRVKPFLRPRGR